MIVKDLSKSFHPCPKNGTQIVNKVENVEKSKVKKKTSKKTSKKNKKEAELKTDFCIMPPSTRYSLKRTKSIVKGMRLYSVEHIDLKAYKMV